MDPSNVSRANYYVSSRRLAGRGNFFLNERPHTHGRPGLIRPCEVTAFSIDQLMVGLGDKVASVPVPSEAAALNPVSIQELQAVASYSWLEAATATIVVPGSPPIWKERSLPYVVPRDAGIVFIDQNASRLPASPLLPLIAAVSHYAPEFSLASVDFITDRNGLRKLCRWASGDPKLGTFRIDVDLMGRKTILMQRCEEETTKPGGPGYENEFEKASTTLSSGCEAATGHNRIVTYDLGGLKMLVRFKCDACLPRKTFTRSRLAKQTTLDEPLDELTEGLQSLTVNTSSTTIPVADSNPTLEPSSLTILTQGSSRPLVPQSDIVELKTCSSKSALTLDWDDNYSQLILSQTPNIFLCVHRGGVFQEVRENKLTDFETKPFARKARENLGKLRNVLGVIQTSVMKEGEGARVSIICGSGGELVVYKREEGGSCLPKEFSEKFK